MPTLVEQLQQEALNQTTPLSQLLRRVKLIAAKLNLSPTAEWVEHELNGYPTKDVPPYRLISGQPRAFNPYNGWIPISGSVAVMAALSRRAVSQSVASLESLVGQDRDGLQFPYPQSTIDSLNRRSDISYAEMGLHVDKSSVIGILDAVRSKVLDWAIELERQGILGSDVGFSDAEAEKAQHSKVLVQVFGGFNGSLNTGDATGQQSRINMASTDRSSNSTGDPAVFKDLLSALAGIRDDAERERISETVEAMRSEVGRPGFMAAYQGFMTAAANHMTVVAPFLPALSLYLGG